MVLWAHVEADNFILIQVQVHQVFGLIQLLWNDGQEIVADIQML